MNDVCVMYRVFQDFESPTSLNLCHCKQLQFPDYRLFSSTHNSSKATPTTFWLKCINLSKSTRLCFTDKLEVADKYFGLLTKKLSHGLANMGVEDGISSNIWVVCWNV